MPVATSAAVRLAEDCRAATPMNCPAPARTRAEQAVACVTLNPAAVAAIPNAAPTGT